MRRDTTSAEDHLSEDPLTASGDGPNLTWLGHASALLELGGERVLFDPLGRGRTRAAGPVGTVLITHSHVDHLHRWSLKAIDRQAHLVVPQGAAGIVADLGFSRVTEVEPGDAFSVGNLTINVVPTNHDNGRWRKGDSPICVGYIASADGISVHHAGDVDFSERRVFDELGKQFAITATLLPIGGMMPVWYYRMRRRALDRGIHIDPDGALDIFERLGAATMVPIHFGTVHLPLGLAQTPRWRLQKIARLRGAEATVRVLAHREPLILRPTATLLAELAAAATRVEAGNGQPSSII